MPPPPNEPSPLARGEGRAAAFGFELAQRFEPRDWRYHLYAGQFWLSEAASTGNPDAVDARVLHHDLSARRAVRFWCRTHIAAFNIAAATMSRLIRYSQRSSVAAPPRSP